MNASIDVLDGCAGPGGWSLAVRALGLREVGIELDPNACATRRAAGHLTVRADVALVTTRRLRRLAGRIRGLIFSPPCGTFSAAGLREGIGDMALLHQALDDLAAGKDPRAALAEACSDPRTPLVVEPLRYALAIRPEWIALEQVPAVLPLWQHIARILRAEGYSTWCGILNAADYGVPQTRRRAILIASRIRTVARPEPTHAKTAEPDTLFGPGRPGWVSMAEALGWGATDRPVPTVTAGGGNTGGAEPFPTRAREILGGERDRGAWAPRVDAGAGGFAKGWGRDSDEPSPTIRLQTQSWVLHTNRDQRPDGTRQTSDPYEAPAPSLTGKSGGQWVLRSGQSAAGEGRAERTLDEAAVSITGRADLNAWAKERPATTVCATDRVAKPGHRDREGGEAQFKDSVRITVEEAAALQTFPADYPWQGTKTQKFLQVGNAVPPLLAAAVIGAATGLDWQSAVEREYAGERVAA